jgi:hypothetical protein
MPEYRKALLGRLWRVQTSRQSEIRCVPHAAFTQQSWLFLNALEADAMAQEDDLRRCSRHRINKNAEKAGQPQSDEELGRWGYGEKADTRSLLVRQAVLWLTSPLTNRMLLEHRSREEDRRSQRDKDYSAFHSDVAKYQRWPPEFFARYIA